MTDKELRLLADEIIRNITPDQVRDYFFDLCGQEMYRNNEIYEFDDYITIEGIAGIEECFIDISFEGDFDFKLFGQMDYEEYVFDEFNGIKCIRIDELFYDDAEWDRHSLSDEELTDLEEMLLRQYRHRV